MSVLEEGEFCSLFTTGEAEKEEGKEIVYHKRRRVTQVAQVVSRRSRRGLREPPNTQEALVR